MQLTIHGKKTFPSATLKSSISMIRVNSERLSIFPLSLDLDFWLQANEIARDKYLIHYHFNTFIGEDFYQFIGKCMC